MRLEVHVWLAMLIERVAPEDPTCVPQHTLEPEIAQRQLVVLALRRFSQVRLAELVATVATVLAQTVAQ